MAGPSAWGGTWLLTRAAGVVTPVVWITVGGASCQLAGANGLRQAEPVGRRAEGSRSRRGGLGCRGSAESVSRRVGVGAGALATVGGAMGLLVGSTAVGRRAADASSRSRRRWAWRRRVCSELAALEAEVGARLLVAGVAAAGMTTASVWIDADAVAGLRWMEPQWLTNLWSSSKVVLYFVVDFGRWPLPKTCRTGVFERVPRRVGTALLRRGNPEARVAGEAERAGRSTGWSPKVPMATMASWFVAAKLAAPVDEGIPPTRIERADTARGRTSTLLRRERAPLPRPGNSSCEGIASCKYPGSQ
jgi:hypothetical protein